MVAEGETEARPEGDECELDDGEGDWESEPGQDHLSRVGGECR
jgi:hypothetical protein